MHMIYKAGTGDMDTLRDIGMEAFADAHHDSAAKQDIDSYIKEKYSRDYLLQELNDSGTFFHLIKHKGAVAGYSKLILNKNCTTASDLNVCKLEQLYFLKEFTSLGLGSTLLQYNIELSRKEGQRGIWLEVWTGNKQAIAFYQKYGFDIAAAGSFPISENHKNPQYIMLCKY